MSAYVRPQWTGEAAHFSDGSPDDEWSQCPSCLSYHHADLERCNGKREPCDERCTAVLGETRCDRPANHLGEHEAKSTFMRVEWEVLAS